MALTVGSRLAEYEITAPIGAGGMGEVYRARDTKLGREVAIKVLPEAFSRDKERLARFEREARLLASVNHPGIATLHGFFESDGVRFLVMELVEGETLEARIERGAIPIEEATPLFLQMSEAMEAAHDKGVIHRDLKPGQHQDHARRQAQDLGLRVGEGLRDTGIACIECLGVPQPSHEPVHFSGGHSGDGALHESRAGAGEVSRQADGHLVVRLCFVRSVDGAESIRWGYGCGHPGGDRQDGAGLGVAAGHDASEGSRASRPLSRERCPPPSARHG